MSGIEILIGDHQGVYIPQQFASWEGWEGISEEEKADLARGPEYDYYWDVWDLVLINASLTDKNGNKWRLYQDGDLFAYCEELMTEEEKENLFGHEVGQDIGQDVGQLAGSFAGHTVGH